MTVGPGCDDAPAIEDLLPSTLDGVARRLLEATTFEELVYRESEMDALFTLVDIAITRSRQGSPAGSAVPPGAAMPDLRRLRDLIFEAHDLTHEDRTAEAAQRLREAAGLVSRWW